MSRPDAASLLSPSPPPFKPHRRGRLLPSILAVLAAAAALFLLAVLRSPPTPSPNLGSLFLSLGSNNTAASHLRALTLHPHVAGTKANSLTAAYVLHAFSSLSIPSHITPYSVLLSYPVHRSLSLSAGPGRAAKSFSLTQDTYPSDPYARAAAEVTPTFFAYSASGSVSAEAVYANYGREEDFAYLSSRGVDGNDTMATIENVFAVIEGAEEPDRYVILGNHRDAWTFGAADPNSGTAAMIELAQRFSMLQKQGWRPRRTIIFCSWDAEEYGLTGSTEWVEENREMLSTRAVAYLNIDVSVVGPVLLPSTTPQLDELLLETIKLVQDPDNSSQTVYDSWVKANASPKIQRLGNGGSDYAAFVQHVGIPSTNLIFGEGPGYPVYHSLYDDFVWVEKFADPGFRRHVAAASIWGIMALRLADEEIIPFDYMSYTTELEAYTKVVEKETEGTTVSCSPLYNSIRALKKAATKVNSERKNWYQDIQRELSSKQLSKDSMRIRGLNDRLMQAERAFTNREGIFKQAWYKHLVSQQLVYTFIFSGIHRDLRTVGAERLGHRVLSRHSRRHSHGEEQQHLGVLEAGAARGSQGRQGRGTSIRRAQREPHMTGSQSVTVSNGKTISIVSGRA
uniref:Putative glutamate carboxypeptidase 2 n=1 Tax=Aegilops tauschii TaxID=37682 RepID=M8AWH3_AEGTA